MRVTALECRCFRNLADPELPLGERLTVVHGSNGAGKTNLLEALYFGLTAHSFRSGTDRDLIGFGHAAARVEVSIDDRGRSSLLLAALERSGERRHLIDGRPLGRLGERPLVSVFHPDRLALVKGPPALRRSHLDRLLAALRPARVGLRSRFGRTLAQRNALAVRVRSGHAPVSALEVWDARLATEAAPLIEARAEAVGALAAPFARRSASLGLASATIAYRPRAQPDPEAMTRRLAELRSPEAGRAYLSHGPQLDEVALRFEHGALRRFGSQGQQRLGLLALLFAERDALLDAGRPPPLLLLDDVMSELDPERRALLVAELEGAGQAVLSATEPGQVPSRRALRVAVERGAVRALAAAA